jgi:hypothetical protein
MPMTIRKALVDAFTAQIEASEDDGYLDAIDLAYDLADAAIEILELSPFGGVAKSYWDSECID